MEDKKIVELINKGKKGDKDSIEEILSIYNKYVDIIFNKCIKGINGLDVDEIKQQGRIGILDAVNSFDESKDVLFSTYVSILIKNRMLNEVKKVQRHLEKIDDTSIDEIDEKGNPILDIPSNTNLLDEIIYSDLLNRFKENIFNVLSEDEKKVLKCFLDNKDVKEISKELNLTEKQVYNAKTRIKEKIVKHIF